MAWERRGALTCYYHPRRVGGRVVKGYFGTGPVAQLAADLVAETKDRRAALVRARRDGWARLARLDGALGRLDRACALMVEAARTVGGRASQGGRGMDARG